MAEGRRPLRVAEDIKAYLGRSIVTGLADSRLQQLVITRVEVPPDLSVAWVYVRSLADAAGNVDRRSLLQSLKRAVPRLRRDLAARLRLRRVPELRFQYDVGVDAAERVEQLLEEIARERPDDAGPGD